jgi:hypothetical protein
MAAQERKRPWYLVVALSLALALGTMSAFGGCARFTFYRAPSDAITAAAPSRDISDDAERAAVEARFQAYLSALDAAKARGWPLSVAALLLGGATVFFAMRTIGGSRSARAALLQLVFAQGILSPVDAWLMRDVERAELRYQEAGQTAILREKAFEKRDVERWTALWDRLLEARIPVGVALHTLGTLFVLVALTRRRSRDFLDAASAAIEER